MRQNTHTSKPFTEDELEENKARRRALAALIKSQQAILFVGAGTSFFRLKHPLWQELLETLEAVAVTCGKEFKRNAVRRREQPIDYAEDIKTHIIAHAREREYYNKIVQAYRPRGVGYDEFHKSLLRLPFRAILTTNYDVVLECAAAQLAAEQFREGNTSGIVPDYSLVFEDQSGSDISRYLISMTQMGQPRLIAHLHGKYDRAQSIVLTRSDYNRCYGAPNELSGPRGEYNGIWTLQRKLLWSLLATRSVVFVGFSMTDTYLNDMLDIVSNDLWLWDEARHFAIMGVQAGGEEQARIKQRQMKGRYGIDLIFYNVVAGSDGAPSHDALATLVSGLEAECALGSHSVTVEPPRDVEVSQQPKTDVNPDQGVTDHERAEGAVLRQKINARFKKMMSHEN